MSIEQHIAKALMPDQCDLDFMEIMKEVVLHAKYGSTEDPMAHTLEAIASEWTGTNMNEDQRIFIRKMLVSMFHFMAPPEESMMRRRRNELIGLP